jgi:hypothetical protein
MCTTYSYTPRVGRLVCVVTLETNIVLLLEEGHRGRSILSFQRRKNLISQFTLKIIIDHLTPTFWKMEFPKIQNPGTNLGEISRFTNIK